MVTTIVQGGRKSQIFRHWIALPQVLVRDSMDSRALRCRAAAALQASYRVSLVALGAVKNASHSNLRPHVTGQWNDHDDGARKNLNSPADPAGSSLFTHVGLDREQHPTSVKHRGRYRPPQTVRSCHLELLRSPAKSWSSGAPSVANDERGPTIKRLGLTLIF